MHFTLLLARYCSAVKLTFAVWPGAGLFMFRAPQKITVFVRNAFSAQEPPLAAKWKPLAKQFPWHKQCGSLVQLQLLAIVQRVWRTFFFLGSSSLQFARFRRHAVGAN